MNIRLPTDSAIHRARRPETRARRSRRRARVRRRIRGLTSLGVRHVARGCAPPCVPLRSGLSVPSCVRPCALTPYAAPPFGSAPRPARDAPMLVATPRRALHVASAVTMRAIARVMDVSWCASHQLCSRCAPPLSCALKRTLAAAAAASHRRGAPSRVRSRSLVSLMRRRASPRERGESLRE